MVAKLFSDKFAKLQKFKDSVKDIPVPLAGDEKAVAEYAKKLDALRAKAGMPSTLEQISMKMSQISTETADDISQAEFFSKAESYREQLGLPKKTFDDIGSALQEMNKKLESAKTAADKTKIAKEYRDKFAAMEKVRHTGGPRAMPFGNARKNQNVISACGVAESLTDLPPRPNPMVPSQKLKVSEAEEKSYFVECIQNFVAKKKSDLMAELETLQKSHGFQTPASSFDLKKAFPSK